MEDDKKVETITKEEKEMLQKELQLQELKLSWAGKLFFAGVSGWLGATAAQGFKKGMSGSPPKLPIKIKGTPEQIKAIQDAIFASKAFQDEITKPNATIEQVIQKLKLRDISKRTFEKLTGRSWPI